jgi:membrane protease YdiL (CAAX protease family)
VALDRLTLLALGIGLALLLARLLWAGRGARLLEVGAAALLAYPVASSVVAALNVADRLTRYTVLLPGTPEQFARSVLHDTAYGLLLPLAGALLLWRTRAGRGGVRTLADVRAALAKVLEPAGVRLAAPPGKAWLDALALLGATLLLLGLALLAQATLLRVLVTGDESSYWIRLTPPLLLGLSLAAGLTEEFVWRGLLLRALLTRLAWWPALLVQAALFGFIHAGYGNWAHVLGPALFGLLMGLVALRVSLLAAVVVHAGIDIAYLALAAPQLQPWILALPAAMLLGGLAALAWTRLRAVRAVLPPWSPRVPRDSG